MALAEGGDGVVFRLVDPQTGQMTPVASYGQALAIDAAGRSRYAELTTSELASGHYRIEMTLPAEWLADASYPLLVDPLIGSLVRVDNTGEEADQARPAVAYRTGYDQFLVVWQDGRNGWSFWWLCCWLVHPRMLRTNRRSPCSRVSARRYRAPRRS